jgi:hypothetical protein
MKRDYPNPCDTCKSAETCVKGFGCTAWLTRYRYRQKQINAYARQKKYEYLGTRFVYQHPNDTRALLRRWPCENFDMKEDCDTPCTQYLTWYDARMTVARKVAERTK